VELRIRHHAELPWRASAIIVCRNNHTAGGLNLRHRANQTRRDVPNETFLATAAASRQFRCVVAIPVAGGFSASCQI